MSPSFAQIVVGLAAVSLSALACAEPGAPAVTSSEPSPPVHGSDPEPSAPRVELEPGPSETPRVVPVATAIQQTPPDAEPIAADAADSPASLDAELLAPVPIVAPGLPIAELPGFAQAEHIAPLMEVGASWTFDVTWEGAIWDDHDPKAGPDGMVRSTRSETLVCTVVEQAVYDLEAVATRIACTGELEPMAGIWIADASGLRKGHGDTLPADRDALRRATRYGEHLVAVEPVVHRDSTVDADGATTHVEVRRGRGGDGWCTSTSFDAGDSSMRGLCLAADGPSWGVSHWSGGSVHETRFERSP